MSLGPVDRRHFLSGGAGIFLCTIAGKRILADGPEPDWDQLAAQIPTPPKVREHELRQLSLLPAPKPALL